MGRAARVEQGVQPAIFEVELVPETWIIAPRCEGEFLKRWGLDESLDRAFPRDPDGRAIFYKIWLESALVRAARMLGIDARVARDWEILDEHGIPVNYIVIPDKPLVYTRFIEQPNGQGTAERFEYIDGSFKLRFRVRTRHPREWVELAALAGKLGVMARRAKGYGKGLGHQAPPPGGFRVKITAK